MAAACLAATEEPYWRPRFVVLPYTAVGFLYILAGGDEDIEGEGGRRREEWEACGG